MTLHNDLYQPEATPVRPSQPFFGQASLVASGPRFGKTDPRLLSLFAPKKIALVGASAKPGTIGRVVLENLQHNHYGGTVYPVNPKYAGQSFDWAGSNVQNAVADIQALPNDVDMAVIMTPKETVPALVDQLGQKGVKSVVVISAGFNEAGPSGQPLEEALKAALNKHQMSMIGPNCVGVANANPGVQMNATFVSGDITPGNGAILSQSGAVSIDLIQQARNAGLGFSQMASIGNQTNVDSSQLIDHWAEDPSVKYILGYLESIKDPEAFRRIATVVSKQKPIVLIKSGKTAVGAKAASSHTGALAGSDTAVDALFQQSGVQRVNSIQDLFSVAKAFEMAPRVPAGPRVGILSNSGGYGVMLTDLIETRFPQLKVATLSDATRDQLKQILPPAASSNNPVDTIATTPSDKPESFKKALLAMAEDPNVDSIVVSVVPLLNIQAADVGKIVAEAQLLTKKPIFTVLSVSEGELVQVQTAVKNQQLKPTPLYQSLESAVTGIGAMENFRLWSEKPLGVEKRFADVDPARVRKIIDTARAENRTLLTTTESLQLLEAYGIATPKHGLARDKAEVMQLATQLGYPLVIKVVSKTITHKTDIGGVKVDLRTPEQLEKAYDELMANINKAGITTFQPGEGVMVQQFMKSGRETLIGFKHDALFGKLMAFGLGGIYVNTLKDVSFRINPLTGTDARDMIQGIKMLDILKGSRGKPEVDFDTLEEVMLRYSQLVHDFPELEESDINPFFAQPKPTPSEKGGIAVDARFTLSATGSSSGPGSSHSPQNTSASSLHGEPWTVVEHLSGRIERTYRRGPDGKAVLISEVHHPGAIRTYSFPDARKQLTAKPEKREQEKTTELSVPPSSLWQHVRAWLRRQRQRWV
ncbi:MAG: acetate--CoA ligase family protein [Cyanobacteria bacterium]|nr:acetate--CoA ligase family protein [Cyanobacteriota bacterium]